MFDVSVWELALVSLVALIVIGPQRIPQVAFRVGRWLRFLRNSIAAISSEMQQQMQQEITSEKEKSSSGEHHEP